MDFLSKKMRNLWSCQKPSIINAKNFLQRIKFGSGKKGNESKIWVGHAARLSILKISCMCLPGNNDSLHSNKTQRSWNLRWSWDPTIKNTLDKPKYLLSSLTLNRKSYASQILVNLFFISLRNDFLEIIRI